MLGDIRYALRTLRLAPAFSIVAIVTLTLAVGATTAMFSVVDAIMIRGLPYQNADRLQNIYEHSETGQDRIPSFPTFLDWQTQSAAVKDVIEGLAFVRGDGVFIAGEPDRQIGAYVTPGFFHLMGARPLIGR